MATNATTVLSDLPPLPEYTLSPQPDMLPFVSDFWLTLFLPHIAYWVVSLAFHIIDMYELFPQYRIHTPEEILQRNHATRSEVLKEVLLEQAIQISSAAILTLMEPAQMVGKEDYDVAVWATRIRLAQRALPSLLGFLGLNAAAISKSMSVSHPLLAGALAGGHYPFLTLEMDGVSGANQTVPAFAAWELMMAKAIYYAIIPFIQFWGSVIVLDTWQYFSHRLMHVNQWMYTHWHSRHHRLYVPYAYGALYNHWVEGFVLDTVGPAIAYKLCFLTPRIGMCLFVFSTIKTVDDHCGYVLPWDPLQRITSNNSAYHDIHHQSWGIKSNYSQPFFTIWDSWLNTKYTGDIKVKYANAREATAKKIAAAKKAADASATPEVAAVATTKEE